MMGLDFGSQLPVFGAFEKPPQLMKIASHEVVGHLDTSRTNRLWMSSFSVRFTQIFWLCFPTFHHKEGTTGIFLNAEPFSIILHFLAKGRESGKAFGLQSFANLFMGKCSKKNTLLLHLFPMSSYERSATFQTSNFLPLFFVLCDFDSFLYI